MFFDCLSSGLPLDGEFSPLVSSDVTGVSETREVFRSPVDPLQVILPDFTRVCVMRGDSSNLISVKESGVEGIFMTDDRLFLLGEISL